MTTFLFEQPWLVGAVGAVLTVATLYGWTQTGNAKAFKTGMALALLSMFLVFLNIWTVTDAERIRTWLAETASELQSNQVDRVLKRISPDPSQRVDNAADRLKSVHFSVAKVTKIHGIEIDYSGTRPIAFIRMNAFVEAESNGMSGKVPRWVGLTLEKRGREWLITDFEDRDAQHEFVNSGSISEALGPKLQGNR
jgi:hypothetical protein